MSPPSYPRCRLKKPKAKSGCRTCKTRRVKCDEGRPLCERCLKFGADCEGYEAGDRLNTFKPGQKEILPKARQHQAFLLPSLGRLPFTTVFRDSREYSYFLHFQQDVALDIASHFDQGLFSHVIIQSSWQEPSLCQLITSVGALYKAENPKALNWPRNETASHRQYAFQQYGRALKSIQARISADQHRDTTRVALIASLLIYCFENLCGDIDSALRHLEAAMQLMQKQLARAGPRYSHSKNSSPTPHLDDDLVAAFFRLDSGILSRDLHFRSEGIGSRLGLHHLEDVCKMPEVFYAIPEARNYLEDIQFPAIPSLSNDLARISMSPLPPNINAKASEIYTILSFRLSQWNEAFAPLYAATLTPQGEKDFISAATLRVRALSTVIASQRVCARDQISLHALNIPSREIVDLSKLVASDPGFLKSFVFDCGIVPGLTIVVAACIDTSIRKEALQVLEDIVPRREGVWDSVGSVKFGRICLGMSEE